MKREKITVNYSKKRDCQGLIARQCVRMSYELFARYNEFMEERRKTFNEPVFRSHRVENTRKCLSQTQLKLLDDFLYMNGIDKRKLIPQTNTMLVIE